MIPPPIVLGFELCEKAIVEEQTRNVTLVNTLSRLWVEEFPSAPEPFVASLVLTSGMGQVTMELIVSQLETDEEVYRDRRSLEFPDRLAVIRLLLPVIGCSFPSPGKYEFTLLINGELVAQRALQVLTREIQQ